MSSTGTPRNDNHWCSIFHRTKMKTVKKKFYETLLESTNQLTVTVTDQHHVITKLTNTNEDLTRQLSAANDNVIEATEAKARIKAKQSVLKESLEILQKNHEAINQSLKQKISNLEDRNRDVSRDHERVTHKVHELEQQASTFKDKVDLLVAENKRLIQEQESLRQNIFAAEKAALEETLKGKMLQKEMECNTDLVERSVEERKQLQGNVAEMKKSLFTTKQEKQEIEHELGGQNETLKFEVTMLARVLQKTKTKIEKLQKDKGILISYYQDKLLNKTAIPESVNCSYGQIHSDTDVPRSILMPDYPHIEYLQNKVFTMESQLFNRDQLIQELADIISGYDPNFSLSQHPQLQVYLDDGPQTAEPDVSKDVLSDWENEPEKTEDMSHLSEIDEAYISMATEIDKTLVLESSSDSTMASSTASDQQDTVVDRNGNINSEHWFPAAESSSSISSF